TEFRIQLSPVPTQTTLGSFGSIAIAPIDCTSSLSNLGANVVPPFVDFQTPPLAAPTYTVRRLPSCTAAIAVTRPDIAADPILRAPRPDVVSESTVVDADGSRMSGVEPDGAGMDAGLGPVDRACVEASGELTFSPGAGRVNRWSSSTGFTVM